MASGSRWLLALDAFEGCVLQLDFCAENLRHVLVDDSKEELLKSTRAVSQLSKAIRHSGGKAKSQEQSRRKKLLPVYFVNHGLTDGEGQVTFSELCELSNDFAHLTSKIYEFNASESR